MMHGYWGWGNHYWGIGIMIVFALIFVGLIAWAVYWAAKRGGKSLIGNDMVDPIEVLKARFAKGEISTEEFRTMRAELTDSIMKNQ